MNEWNMSLDELLRMAVRKLCDSISIEEYDQRACGLKAASFAPHVVHLHSTLPWSDTSSLSSTGVPGQSSARLVGRKASQSQLDDGSSFSFVLSVPPTELGAALDLLHAKFCIAALFQKCLTSFHVDSLHLGHKSWSKLTDGVMHSHDVVAMDVAGAEAHSVAVVLNPSVPCALRIPSQLSLHSLSVEELLDLEQKMYGDVFTKDVRGAALAWLQVRSLASAGDVVASECCEAEKIWERLKDVNTAVRTDVPAIVEFLQHHVHANVAGAIDLCSEGIEVQRDIVSSCLRIFVSRHLCIVDFLFCKHAILEWPTHKHWEVILATATRDTFDAVGLQPCGNDLNKILPQPSHSEGSFGFSLPMYRRAALGRTKARCDRLLIATNSSSLGGHLVQSSTLVSSLRSVLSRLASEKPQFFVGDTQSDPRSSMMSSCMAESISKIICAAQRVGRQAFVQECFDLLRISVSDPSESDIRSAAETFFSHDRDARFLATQSE